MTHPILIDGQWQASAGSETFTATNPADGRSLDGDYPVSNRADIEAAAGAAGRAFEQCRDWPGEKFADFLDAYAAKIDAHGEALASKAHEETGLPVSPRLLDVEVPRTSNQMRAGAEAARTYSWATPRIDTAAGIRSMLGPVGPVAIFGPNNFPLAINPIAGNDFVAAVAAGCPVIAKGHPLHPGTTRLFGELAQQAAEETAMPAGFVQLIYHMSNDDGVALLERPEIAAAAFTGSRAGGLALKAVADKHGKPFYAEMSAINPVFVLPGALAERDDLVDEFFGSCTLGAGQFCTNPGLIVLMKGEASDAFVAAAGEKFADAGPMTTLGQGVTDHYEKSLATLKVAGAEVVARGSEHDGPGARAVPTLLKTTADTLLKNDDLLTEAFGPSSLVVMCESLDEAVAVARAQEGNLTGCLYTAKDGRDDGAYDAIAGVLRTKVGRLLNDKMPTGVAVSRAMNHGGPFPASGHPGFSSMGLPQSVTRFGALQSYDAVRPHRLPAVLQDANPGGVWRDIDGTWTQDEVALA